jgi:hypothetical protein
MGYGIIVGNASSMLSVRHLLERRTALYSTQAHVHPYFLFSLPTHFSF